MKENDFDEKKIGQMLAKKCDIAGIGFNPGLIFDERRISEAKKFWDIALGRLTKDLPEFDGVMKELKDKLAFLTE